MIFQDPLVYVFEDIVTAVSAELTASLQVIDPKITGVHYLHGHPQEIVETLAEMDQSKTQKWNKYPLICLFQDFPISRGTIGIEGKTKLRFAICTSTMPTYKAYERQERSFDPILYPIYNEFLKQIDKSKAFKTYGVSRIIHTQWDRMYWGREGLGKENVFSDRLDAIELRDMELIVNLKNCR